MFFAVLVITPVLALRRKWPKLSRRYVIYFLIVGLTGTVLPNSFSYLAAAELPAGIMSIIIASVPMFSIAIAFTFKVEQFSFARLVGVALGAAAVLVLIVPEEGLSGIAKPAFIFVALVAPFFYGVEGNYIAAKAPAKLDALSTLWGASLLGLLFAAPLTYFLGAWVDLTKPWQAPEWALLASSFLHIIAYSSYIWLTANAGPIFSSQIAYIVTISGVFLSALALGETYPAWVWAALAIMLGGLALVQPRNTPREISSETS